MKYEIRKSDSQKDYYTLIRLDADGNEKLIADGSLKDVQSHKEAKGLKPVNEADVRGTVEQPEQEPQTPPTE